MQHPADAATIPQAVRAAAERFGAATAIEDGATLLTYRALWEHGIAATRAYVAAGIETGDRVAIWAPNLWEWIVAAIGAQGAGAAIVPLSTRLKGREVAYQLRKSRARILCTVGEFLGTNPVELLRGEDTPDLEKTLTLRGEADGALAWSEFLAGGEAIERSVAEERATSVRADDLSDILFTSGTTGSPKGVMCNHGQSLRTFACWSELVGLREGDRYLVVNTFSHSFGYKAGWLACILRGATCLPEAVFDVGAIFERVARDRISVLPGPPTIYQSLLVHPDLPNADIASLRLAVTGAAPVPMELVHRMRDELSFDTIVTAYGLTECCGFVSICRPGDAAETISTTSGRAIPGVEVRCVDEDGKEVPFGEPGEVLVRGYNVMQGYFEDEAATAEAIDTDGWLHTGDIAVMDERGYLRITDRIKDMFIMGGFNCYPAEIENLMFGSGNFAQVAVIGVPDERMGEVAMAFVVPAPGRELTPEGIISWCRENMANYKVPRRVEIVDELPLSATGKVTKYVLRERAAELAGT